MDGRRKIPFSYLLAAMLIALAVQTWFARPQEIRIDYSDFKTLIRAGQIEEVRIAERTISGTIDPAAARTEIPEAVRKVLPRDATAEPIALKKNRVMNPKEKETVAYHEAGHALIAELRTTTDKVAKVTIIPRGIGALGFTQQLPTEDRYLMKRSELLDRLDVLLGGRVAEQLVFNETSTGAQDDLQRATDLARHMVAQYGMSESLGPAVLDMRSGAVYLGELSMPPRREFSEETARRIDAEVQQLLREGESRVRETLTARRKEIEALAQLLLRYETVERDALLRVLASEQPIDAQAAPVRSGAAAGVVVDAA